MIMHREVYWKYVKKNRYGNVAQKTSYKGITYHSKLEAKFAQDLDNRKLAGDIKDWKRQIPFRIISEGVSFGTYYVDFAIEHNDGTIEYAEVKGKGLSAGMNKFRWLEKKFEGDPKVIVRLYRG